MPLPPADWLQHSQQLTNVILQDIEAAGGAISFAEYMHAVLYRPGQGYYSSAAQKLGELGDFVTAPEISPLFGLCLANCCGELFTQDCARQVLEFGAGSGKLCQQLLENQSGIHRYFILEVSADLRQRQQQYLQSVLDETTFGKIQWLDRLPEQFDGLVVANEVLDAMPVHVVRKQQQWQELGVAAADGQLTWCVMAEDSPAVRRIQQIEAEVGLLPEGYRTEVNLNYQPWFDALAGIAGEQACLLIDYGDERQDYYRHSRADGSLRCYFQHRLHHDPFFYPGLQDITADVDFDAVADAAEDAGYALLGLTTQANFLMNHGLLSVAQNLSERADTIERLAIAQQVKSLTLPGEMGQRFKVLLLSRGLSLTALIDSAGRIPHG